MAKSCSKSLEYWYISKEEQLMKEWMKKWMTQKVYINILSLINAKYEKKQEKKEKKQTIIYIQKQKTIQPETELRNNRNTKTEMYLNDLFNVPVEILRYVLICSKTIW